MTKRISLIITTSLTALFVALCAAVFSVTGIAKLFAGAAISAAIMASALEIGKIVSISFLYQYWSEVPKTLKLYLTVAAIVLMFITSAGIYGYLSAAYARVAADPLRINAEVQSLTTQVLTIDQDIQRRTTRLDQLINLRAQQENRLDSLIIRSQSGNTGSIRRAQTSLSASDGTIAQLQREITNLSSRRDTLQTQKITKQVEVETNTEIGSFLYISKMLNVPLDTVVKWFTLIIVLVFDPLAVALVIAVNFLAKKRDTKKHVYISPKEEIKKEQIEELHNLEPFTETTEETKQVIIESPPFTETSSYVPNELTDDEILSKYLNIDESGRPEWMNPAFNWDDSAQWINNPVARLYKKHVRDNI